MVNLGSSSDTSNDQETILQMFLSDIIFLAIQSSLVNTLCLTEKWMLENAARAGILKANLLLTESQVIIIKVSFLSVLVQSLFGEPLHAEPYRRLRGIYAD